MAKKKLPLKDFLKTSEFSDDVYRDIFMALVTKHKNESARQHLIRAVILIWERNYPAEVNYHNKVMKQIRETRANKFAADNKEDMRLAFKIPQTLWNRLSLLVKDPEFLHQSNPILKEEQEERDWFAKQFPEFKVPEKF